MSGRHFTWRQLYEIVLNHVIFQIGNIWLQLLQTLLHELQNAKIKLSMLKRQLFYTVYAWETVAW